MNACCMIRRWARCSSKSRSIRPPWKNGPISASHAGPLAKSRSGLRSTCSQASGPLTATTGPIGLRAQLIGPNRRGAPASWAGSRGTAPACGRAAGRRCRPSRGAARCPAAGRPAAACGDGQARLALMTSPSTPEPLGQDVDVGQRRCPHAGRPRGHPAHPAQQAPRSRAVWAGGAGRARARTPRRPGATGAGRRAASRGRRRRASLATCTTRVRVKRSMPCAAVAPAQARGLPAVHRQLHVAEVEDGVVDGDRAGLDASGQGLARARCRWSRHWPPGRSRCRWPAPAASSRIGHAHDRDRRAEGLLGHAAHASGRRRPARSAGGTRRAAGRAAAHHHAGAPLDRVGDVGAHHVQLRRVDEGRQVRGPGPRGHALVQLRGRGRRRGRRTRRGRGPRRRRARPRCRPGRC